MKEIDYWIVTTLIPELQQYVTRLLQFVNCNSWYAAIRYKLKQTNRTLNVCSQNILSRPTWLWALWEVDIIIVFQRKTSQRAVRSWNTCITTPLVIRQRNDRHTRKNAVERFLPDIFWGENTTIINSSRESVCVDMFSRICRKKMRPRQYSQ